MKRALGVSPREIQQAFELARPELERFLERVLLRPEGVDEILTETAARAGKLDRHAPKRPEALRLWLWRVACGLALAEWTARPGWREDPLASSLRRARLDPGFVRLSEELRAAPSMSHIARDHMLFCLAQTIAQLPPHHALALHLFNLTELSSAAIAEILDCRVAQAERWSSEARAAVEDQLTRSCGLARGRGSCRQCLELDRGFCNQERDPLAGGNGSLDARLDAARRLRGARLPSWHQSLVLTLDRIARS